MSKPICNNCRGIISEYVFCKKCKDAEEYSLLGLIADIRAAVGDPEGRLMQDELVEHCRKLYEASIYL